MLHTNTPPGLSVESLIWVMERLGEGQGRIVAIEGEVGERTVTVELHGPLLVTVAEPYQDLAEGEIAYFIFRLALGAPVVRKDGSDGY